MEGDPKRFPLVRTFWSNEKAMALLFALLIAWQVPSWRMGSAVPALQFARLVALALFVDAVCNLVRYRRFLCSVSASVTAGVVCVLAPACAPAASYPLTLSSVAASLVFGKHLFGGTGKNVCNPAMLALAVMVLVSSHGLPSQGVFTAMAEVSLASVARAWPFIVACACLPFLAFRPFAGGSFAFGAVIPLCMAVFGTGGFTPLYVPALASAAALLLFTASVAMTDPVTVTAHPVAGAAVGALAGALSCASLLGLGGLSSGALPFVILAVNVLSRAVDRFLPPVRAKGLVRVRRIASRSKTLFSEGLDGKRGASRADGDLKIGTSLETLSSDEILSRIRAAGIVGLGGAGFPTDVKIEAFRASTAPRKLLIVNAVECDPGLVHDKWILANKGSEIAEAIAILKIACGCDEATLAVNRGTPVSPDLVSRLSEGVRLVRVPDRYPVGAERILIRRVAGVKILPGEIPAREGFLVLNVQTALAAREAILSSPRIACDGLRAGERYLTVADLRARDRKVIRAREGESIAAVFARAFSASSGGHLFAGGGLMQAYRAYEDEAVGPGVNFIARGNAPRFRETPQCSRCLRCVALCPAGLDVREIAEFVDAGQYDRAAARGAARCLSCGICSASCLAGKNLSHRLSLAKRYSREGVKDLPETLA